MLSGVGSGVKTSQRRHGPHDFPAREFGFPKSHCHPWSKSPRYTFGHQGRWAPLLGLGLSLDLSVVMQRLRLTKIHRPDEQDFGILIMGTTHGPLTLEAIWSPPY